MISIQTELEGQKLVESYDYKQISAEESGTNRFKISKYEYTKRPD